MADCILKHDTTLCHNGTRDFTCSIADKICAWDNYDYSDPNTTRVAYLIPGTEAKILKEKFPGVLVELEDGTQYWVCEWDVHKIDG